MSVLTLGVDMMGRFCWNDIAKILFFHDKMPAEESFLAVMCFFSYFCAMKENHLPSMTYRQLWQQLVPLYEEGEAKAIVRTVLETRMGMSMTDILCDGTSRMSEEERVGLERMMEQLREAVPVQYVLGEAPFMGRMMCVEPGVLIPRPETEVLCRWVMDDCRADQPRILDVGCGSGCIAVSLALEIPGAQVTAFDISAKALEMTARNASLLGAPVVVERRDALHLMAETGRWEVIVSNPPYICEGEATAMHRNVLDHEPHEALFVPDADPLLFYRAIARYAATALTDGGALFFECNPCYVPATVTMLGEIGFTEVQTREDQFGKLRFVKAGKYEK